MTTRTTEEYDAMMYPEPIVLPMRQELTRLGVEELRTADAVDVRLGQTKGTTMVVVNSVCGCAARNARPAVAIALQHTVKPDVSATVFAGQDADATARARQYFTGFAPSSPSIALLKDGELVYMLERWQIEGRSAHDIARDLASAFERHCAGTPGGKESGATPATTSDAPARTPLPIV